MIDPNILTGLMYVGSVFLLGTRWYLGLTTVHLRRRLLFRKRTDDMVNILSAGVMADNGIVNTIDHDYLTSGRHSAESFFHVLHRFFPLTDKPHSLS